MRGDGILDVAAIAAADGDRDGDPNLATQVEYHRVTAREPVEGQRETAEPVTFVWIGAGDVDDQIGCRRREHARQCRRELGEIDVVARAVGELDVERAGDLVKGIVPP